MNRGEVWWVEFDPAIGGEIRKTRPAVIVSNDTSNRHLARVQVMPLSSNVERIYPSETVVTLAGQRSKVMADQIMTADKRRLKTTLGRLSQADMLAVERVIRLQLGLN
jgi:mRNA interferase MazF